jgi:hypothetical protein
MKSYILIMTAIHCVFCVVCYSKPDSYNNFFFSVFVIYFTVGFVDTLGEGMTAMITKMDQRIEELTPPENRKEKESESKAIGFFFMFRLFIRTLSMFAGGVMSSRGINIRVIYVILFFSPLSMFLYTLFVFKEARVSPSPPLKFANSSRKRRCGTDAAKLSLPSALSSRSLSTQVFCCHFYTTLS